MIAIFVDQSRCSASLRKISAVCSTVTFSHSVMIQIDRARRHEDTEDAASKKVAFSISVRVEDDQPGVLLFG